MEKTQLRPPSDRPLAEYQREMKQRYPENPEIYTIVPRVNLSVFNTGRPASLKEVAHQILLAFGFPQLNSDTRVRAIPDELTPEQEKKEVDLFNHGFNQYNLDVASRLLINENREALSVADFHERNLADGFAYGHALNSCITLLPATVNKEAIATILDPRTRGMLLGDGPSQMFLSFDFPTQPQLTNIKYPLDHHMLSLAGPGSAYYMRRQDGHIMLQTVLGCFEMGYNQRTYGLIDADVELGVTYSQKERRLCLERGKLAVSHAIPCLNTSTLGYVTPTLQWFQNPNTWGMEEAWNTFYPLPSTKSIKQQQPVRRHHDLTDFNST